QEGLFPRYPHGDVVVDRFRPAEHVENAIARGKVLPRGPFRFAAIGAAPELGRHGYLPFRSFATARNTGIIITMRAKKIATHSATLIALSFSGFLASVIDFVAPIGEPVPRRRSTRRGRGR